MATRSARDWGLFGLLTVTWGSAYVLTKLAVNEIPPSIMVVCRLSLGAALLTAVMLVQRHHFPPISDRKRWIYIAGLGVVGMTIPFLFITHAQQVIDSSLAALYVAAAPIFTAVGASFLFPDERLTLRRAIGVGLGFVGMVILIGPDVLNDIGASSTLAQLGLLVATLCYAGGSFIARSVPETHSLVLAAGYVAVGALATLPFALMGEALTEVPSTQAILAVIGLGIGPSAIAALAYMSLVRSAGPTFLSLTGYLIPVWAAFLGWLVFGETPDPSAAIAFVLILIGVLLAQKVSVSSSAGSKPASRLSGR